jgi:hypothetical protein
MLFKYASLYIGLVPLCIALYRFAYLDKPLKIAMYRVLFHLIIVTASIITAKFNITNTFLYFILCFGLAVFIGLIFSYSVKGALKKSFIIYSTVAYLLFLCLDAFFISGTNTFKNFSFTLFDIWAIIVIAIYISHVLQDYTIPNLRKHPLLWIAIGIIITYLGSIIHVLLSYSTLAISKKMFFITENITFFSNIVGIVLQSYGFWISKKNNRMMNT